MLFGCRVGNELAARFKNVKGQILCAKLENSQPNKYASFW